MIKPVLKTLSLSAFTLIAAATVSASEQKATLLLASMPSETSIVACSPQADVDQGWEYQRELLKARIAARRDATANVPGAIITPPFEDHAPYRTDLPATAAVRQSVVERSANQF